MSNCSCGCSSKKNILIYACSGGANVGEIADRAARQLMYEKAGSMSCLAGIGGGVDGIVQSARNADVNFVLDGCPMDCARKVFQKAGIESFKHLRVTDLGFVKSKGEPCRDQDVQTVVARAKTLLAEL